MISDYVPDLYSPGGLPTSNEVGFFTGQSNISVTDLFQLETPPIHPVYHDMFTFVSVSVCYRSEL